MKLNRLTFTLGLMVAGAASAGTVQVDFIVPTSYADAGRTLAEAQANRDTLGRYLQSLGGRYLAAGEALKIDVLDIDLAGTVRPFRRANGDLRITRGSADYPRIKLRYSFVSGDKVVSSGEETVSDLNYLGHTANYANEDPLRFEKRMLADWFKARFVEHRAAAG